MKKIILMTMALSITLGIMVGNAYSQQSTCPQWAMPPINSGYQCAPVPLAYMGVFNTAWNWTYNPTYLNEMDNWGPYNAHDQSENWMPRKALNWAPAQNLGGPNLHVQYKNSGAGTRAYFQLPERVIEYPEVYRWSQGNIFKGFVASFLPPVGCTPPGPSSCPPGSKDPCCQPPTLPAFNKKQSFDPQQVTDFSDIQSVCWKRKEICVDSDTNFDLVGVQRESLISVSYDYTSSNPFRQKYSFWPSGVTNWMTYDYPMVYANFEAGVVPDEGPQTIIVDISGVTHELLFIGGDTSAPSIVPLTAQISGEVVNKKGKIKDKENTIQVENVMAYEDSFGDLIIKWGEPSDLVFEPYSQVRVSIGDKASPLTPAPIFDSLTFAFLEVPFPSSTAVLPAATWGELKKELSCTKGENTVYISIFYRRVYMNATPGSKNEMLQVRSVSDPLPYQFLSPGCTQ